MTERRMTIKQGIIAIIQEIITDSMAIIYCTIAMIEDGMIVPESSRAITEGSMTIM